MPRLRIAATWLSCVFVAVVVPLESVLADNQTPDTSPVVIGGSLPFTAEIQSPVTQGDTLPTLQSFAKAQYNGEWLLVGGITSGMHSIATGFDPTYQNSNVFVVDPTTHQVWSRSLATDPNSGLTQDAVDSLSSSNTEFTQQGSHLYVAGGFGQGAISGLYQTYSNLTSVDLPGLMNWVKGGSGTAANSIRQISDPMFQVTGGEMATSSTGQSLLVFGQNYPSSYEARQTGTYTDQVRSFTIVDNAAGLSVTNASATTPQDDFRRRDLNVVPTIQKVNGQLVQKFQALAGVFTPSFGTWTVPVTIDASGNATEPDPSAAGTFKQGMNSYRSANIELYSASSNTMHTLLLGGISYQYYDPPSNSIQSDPSIPYINDVTDIMTDAQGHMTQSLLPNSYPTILAPTNGQPLLFGAEAEFFLKDGVPTYSNGVIDLDALTGPTLVGYLFGGIAADAPNGGNTTASNEMFPVVITPQELFLPGDFNRDGKVTVADVQAMLAALSDLSDYQSQNALTSQELALIGDLNGDGHVTNADIQALIAQLANGGGGALNAVPEPDAALLFALGLTAFVLISRRQRGFVSADV